MSAWANWAEAYFNYCDGGSLTGTRLAPDTNHTAGGQDCPNATCNGPPIYYRGQHNFVAMLAQVIEQVKPTEVLLSGGSAGGMAVYHQCDRAAAILAKHSIPLRCMPDAGLFPGDDWRVPDIGNSWMADNMESKPGLNAACVEAYEQNRSDWRVCVKGAAALRYITVRAAQGWLSAISVLHRKSILYAAFVCARKALNGRKRRFPARADPDVPAQQPLQLVRHSPKITLNNILLRFLCEPPEPFRI